ncbi:hypothetical protein CRM22_005235 [Opisthorchis felineus]|uniref:RRM domain-containing protein n=1 Tax=Opisthorchis felineus TaxID=147828 RepID=A0A4S2LS33_OPIFE|nr:hypothetical protein CRM22_005235 [Opisthorchis felineus]
MMAVDSQGNEVGKLFVGGLHQSTTNDSLKSYFSKFGEIEESIVMMDNRTGRSRGFGYIKYKESTSVDSVLAQKLHVVDHKEVDPKRCNINMKGKNRRSLKIFVGGISFEHDESTIRNFFSKYGRVTDVNLLTSPNKQRHRGFAFVGFDDEEVVKNLIRMHFLNLDGKQVEVKAMEPPISQRPNYPVSPGGPIHLQANGRAVRGGRTNHFAQIPSNDSFSPWNQWSGVGTTGSWNPTSGPPGPQPPWSQAVGWNGGGGSASGNHHGSQSVGGPASHMPSLGPNPGLGWTDQQGTSTNGWVPSGWGPHVTGPALNNRGLGDEVSLYSLQQQQRKTRPTWDSMCFAALTSGVNSTPNPGDLVSSLDTWNHPAAAANAALCQLTQLPIGSGLPPAPAGATDWNQVSATTPGSGSANWNGSNPGAMSIQAANSVQQGGTGSNNMQSGFLSDHSGAPHPHQNGATMAAMAAAFGIGGSGSVPHWTSGPGPGPGDPGNLKLDDALYRSSGGYGLSSTGVPTNGSASLHQPANGLLPGDWRAVTGPTVGSTASIPGYHPGPQPQPQQQQQHMYKR